jgi:hypothetical protein
MKVTITKSKRNLNHNKYHIWIGKMFSKHNSHFKLSTFLSTNLPTQQNPLLIVCNNLFFYWWNFVIKWNLKFKNFKKKVILEGFHHQKWEKKLVIHIIFEPWRCSIDMIHIHQLPTYPPTQQTHFFVVNNLLLISENFAEKQSTYIPMQ